MASTSGVTRRRGGGGGAGGSPHNEDESGRVTPNPGKRPESTSGGLETSYESGANGHKIAYDPAELKARAEQDKQPKLTLMEEVLLMGLKDKQVCTTMHCA